MSRPVFFVLVTVENELSIRIIFSILLKSNELIIRMSNKYIIGSLMKIIFQSNSEYNFIFYVTCHFSKLQYILLHSQLGSFHLFIFPVIGFRL